MSDNINFDFEACNKCVRELISLRDKWEINRLSIPQIEGQGIFMDEIKEIMEAFDMLHSYFETLAIDSGVYIQQVVTEMKKTDEAAKE